METVFGLVNISMRIDGNQSIQNELRFYQEIRESDAFTDCVENEKTGHGQGAQRIAQELYEINILKKSNIQNI